MEEKTEIIKVKVNGIYYDTYLDNGVQRFVKDSLIIYLYSIGKIIDLNKMYVDFERGAFKLEDYHRFYAGTGYSVAGFEEIFCQNQDSQTIIENPLWEK